MELQFDAFYWSLSGTELSPRYPPEDISTTLDTISARVSDLWKVKGLDATNPLTASGDGVTSKTLTVDGITLTITPDGATRT